MRLLRVEIERYGLLENLELADLAPGLNLVAGGNEAGKTTLLSFIRGVLFGFSTGRKAGTNDYRLDPADRLGGRLLVAGREYPKGVTIERRSGKGGGPVSLYLPDGTRVAEETLGRLLGNIDSTLYRNVFAFGLSELASLENLDSRELRARIYSAGTGTGAVAATEALKRLQTERDKLFTPRGSKPELNAVLGRLQALEKELHALTAHADRYSELVRQRADLEKELEGLVRSERQNTVLLEEKQRLSRGRASWEQYCAEQARLSELEDLPEDFPLRAEERLAGLNETIREASRELEDLERRLGEEKAGFVRDEELERLYDLREKAASLAQGLGQYEKALDDLPGRRAELEAVQQSLAKKMAEIDRAWTVEDLLGFDSSIATRDRLRSLKQALEETGLRLSGAGQSLRHAEDEFSRVDEQYRQAEGRLAAARGSSVSLLGPLSLAGGLAALALGVWMIFAGHVISGALVSAAGAGFLLFRVWLWRARGPGAAGRGELERLGQERAGRSEKLESERAAKDRASADLEGRREDLSDFLAGLGLDRMLSPDALGEVLGQVSLAREQHEKAGQLGQRIGEMEGFVGDYHARVCALCTELEQDEPGRKDAAGTVGRLLQDLERARQYHTGREKHLQNVEFLAGQAEKQRRKLDSLLEDKARLVAVSSGQQDISPEAAEDRFRQHAGVAAERELCQGRRKEALSQLAAYAGSPDNLESYLADLAKTPFDRLEEEISSLQEEKNRVEEEKQRVNRQLGETGKALEEVSTGTRAGSLLLERSSAVEELAVLTERWAVLSLAELAVRQAMERYERERQPEVLRHAQEYFSQMTAGRWERILNPVGEQRFEVVSARGMRLPPEKLSRGTAEQLYLALRLGLVEERKNHSEPVPLMMDDVLVNFDPERARAACRAVAGIAQSHQVIYLTCHPHVVELFRSEVPEVNMLTLDLP